MLIGGSYIGTEVAASLTAKGVECSIVAMEEVALSRTFGEDAGRWFQELLESQGRRVPRRRGAGGLRGRRPGQRGADQERPGDRVRHGRRRRRRAARRDARRSGPGSRSTTGSSATRSSRPRSTGIYAAGDCCSYDSVVHGRRIRVEHWDVAMQQGMPRRRATCSAPTRDYDVVPYFFSDLADWAGLEYVGPAQDWDEEVWRGDRERRRVLGLVPEGRPGRGRAQRRALRGPGAKRGGCWPSGVDVSGVRERIADADSDLSEIGA